MRVFPADYYASLGRVLRREEEIDMDELTTHLASVGYSRDGHGRNARPVHPPRRHPRRLLPGGDRPVRMELFGDEIESMRKFEPDSQRSSTADRRDLAVAADRDAGLGGTAGRVHQRLSWKPPRSRRGPGTAEPGARRRRRKRLSRMGVFLRRGRRRPHPLRPVAARAGSSWKSRRWCGTRLERWWNKVEQRHERSGIGSLITPDDIYLSP